LLGTGLFALNKTKANYVLFVDFSGHPEMASHENEVVTGRWWPRVTSHCDRHHKQQIEIHLSVI